MGDNQINTEFFVGWGDETDGSDETYEPDKADKSVYLISLIGLIRLIGLVTPISLYGNIRTLSCPWLAR